MPLPRRAMDRHRASSEEGTASSRSPQVDSNRSQIPSGQLVDDPLLSSSHSVSYPARQIECDDTQHVSTRTHRRSVSLGGGHEEAGHDWLGGDGLLSPRIVPNRLSGGLKASAGGESCAQSPGGAGTSHVGTRVSPSHGVKTSIALGVGPRGGRTSDLIDTSAAESSIATVGDSPVEGVETFGDHLAVHPGLSQAEVKPAEKRDDDAHISEEVRLVKWP